MKTHLLKLTLRLARPDAVVAAPTQSPVSLLFNLFRTSLQNQFDDKLRLAVFVGCAILLLETRPTQAVGYDISTTTVSSSPNPSSSGQSVTFTVTVTRTTTNRGTGTPAGTVTFKQGTTMLGTGTLSGSGLVATTTFSTNGLSGGSHTITASCPDNSSISLAGSSGTCTQIVNSVLAITSQPVSAVVTLGHGAGLSVTNSGTAPFGYQWIKDGVMLAGQTNSILSFASFQFANSGSYQVIITNVQGMVISLPASLSLSNAPLKAWGGNSSGQLGLGSIDYNNHYASASVASNVVAVAAGGSHSLFIKNDGTLWAMGNNTDGQLGNGTVNSASSSQAVASNVVAVAAGNSHSLFVKNDGTLWTMGYNNAGQLGNGNYTSTNLPVSVSSNVVAVAAGGNYSLFVKNDGSLWAMGVNNYGQLGNGTLNSTNLPVSVSSNVVAVAAGANYSMFVKADGSLWTMGANNYGQLGNGTLDSTNLPVSVASNVVAMAAGNGHSLFVKSDGTLWAMGYNNYGELGIGTIVNTNLPVSVASNVVMVAAGNYHSLFVKNDGTLWAMGYNYYGRLGVPGGSQYNSPLQVPGMMVASLGALDEANHSLAVGWAAPGATTLPDQAVTFGQSFTFTLVVTRGDGPFTYQWQLNGTNIANATNVSYTVASTAFTDAGTYTGIATDLAGSGNQSARLTVNPVANPTNIVSSVNGGNRGTLNLSWPTDHLGWVLQVQTNSLVIGLSTNWVDVTGSAATNSVSLPLDVTQPAVFYRLRLPSGI